MLEEVGRGITGLFRAELAWGLLAGALAAAARALVPSVRPVLTPGLVAALAVAAVLARPTVALAGVVGAVVAWRWPQWRNSAAVFAVVVAALTVVAPDQRNLSSAVVALAAGVFSGLAAASADRAGRQACALALLSGLGWYAGLPDTEGALVVVGVMAASLVIVAELGATPFAAAGAAVVVVGSGGRPAALLGALVCGGLLLVPPLSTVRFRLATAVAGVGWRMPAAAAEVVVQAAIVVYGSRVVGRPQPLGRALLLAVPVVVLLAVVALLGRSRRAR